MIDPIPGTGNPRVVPAATAPPARRWAPRIPLVSLHIRPRPGQQVTRCATFARTIRTADALGLAAGMVLGAWLIGSLPTVAVSVAMLTELLATSRYRWRFKPSLIDDLPSTVALLGAITLLSSTASLLVGYPSEARGVLGAGVIILGTTLFGRALAYLVAYCASEASGWSTR